MLIKNVLEEICQVKNLIFFLSQKWSKRLIKLMALVRQTDSFSADALLWNNNIQQLTCCFVLNNGNNQTHGLPIVHCDAIYTVRAQNCPLKSNGQPVTKFMLFCFSAVLCRCICMYVDTIFFRISKLHVYVQVPMQYLLYVSTNMCRQK